MKKLISFILSVVMTGILLLPVNVQAANINSKAGTVNISGGHLNVRSSAGTSGAVTAKLQQYSFVTLISSHGDWWYVEYDNGKFGYCHADYITTLSSKAHSVNISSGSLNVRSGPSTVYTKIGSLKKNETVLVLSVSGEWSRILYHGTKTGYVHSKYLSGTVSADRYSAVYLNVPDFKQTDSRWANVIIGNSGKTIGRIGCVTTGIAMLESYRTGRTIYPDAMSKRLSYSSSGNIYWPSDYVVTTSNTDYLSKIYNILKQGKPVLFGAKNSSGGQHWVVITGYKGGDTLSASQFTINDPGSNTRTTLQQFLNNYPVFYKYFRY